jgi:hypothetical protein
VILRISFLRMPVLSGRAPQSPIAVGVGGTRWGTAGHSEAF